MIVGSGRKRSKIFCQSSMLSVHPHYNMLPIHPLINTTHQAAMLLPFRTFPAQPMLLTTNLMLMVRIRLH
ncbi:hypothetical protein CICLE_v10030427mg [Citrus x clementina]|uniref:Uncharacterized protein n=1 Tax=Citrus clementina TaxID=85681 RepID=V4SAG8_CITCL|nr:hypothetical protein CICLE_v10030427mg [Citrus x clementina]